MQLGRELQSVQGCSNRDRQWVLKSVYVVSVCAVRKLGKSKKRDDGGAGVGLTAVGDGMTRKVGRMELLIRKESPVIRKVGL